MRFVNRRVLVTGASRGLGRAIAIRLATEGAFVYVGHRARGDAAAETVNLLGGKGCAIAFDVQDSPSVERAVGEMLSAGPLDVLINNAGVADDAPFAMMSASAFDEVVSTSLRGAFHTMRALARSMMANKRGAIVNVASVAGLHASPGQANYSAAKAGLIGLTRTVAAELAPYGVRVNAVAPGLLSTGMVLALDRRILERKLQAVPLKRTGSAEEVAAAVAFLASDEASYVIGQTLVIDGGLSL